MGGNPTSENLANLKSLLKSPTPQVKLIAAEQLAKNGKELNAVLNAIRHQNKADAAGIIPRVIEHAARHSGSHLDDIPKLAEHFDAPKALEYASKIQGNHNEQIRGVATNLFKGLDNYNSAPDPTPLIPASKAIENSIHPENKQDQSEIVNWLDEQLPHVGSILSKLHKHMNNRESWEYDQYQKYRVVESNLRRALIATLFADGDHQPRAVEAVEKIIPLRELSSEELKKLANFPNANHANIISHAEQYGSLFDKAVAESCKHWNPDLCAPEKITGILLKIAEKNPETARQGFRNIATQNNLDFIVPLKQQDAVNRLLKETRPLKRQAGANKPLGKIMATLRRVRFGRH